MNNNLDTVEQARRQGILQNLSANLVMEMKNMDHLTADEWNARLLHKQRHAGSFLRNLRQRGENGYEGMGTATITHKMQYGQ